jgi:hypothetical protein
MVLAISSLAVLVGGCNAPRTVLPGPARWIALQVDLPPFDLSVFRRKNFEQALQAELAERNVRVDDRGGTPVEARFRIQLGAYVDDHVIDVFRVEGDAEKSVGRVLVPDRSMTTLDVSASLVAEVIVAALRHAVDPLPAGT